MASYLSLTQAASDGERAHGAARIRPLKRPSIAARAIRLARAFEIIYNRARLFEEIVSTCSDPVVLCSGAKEEGEQFLY
jgi:hypothetical protein